MATASTKRLITHPRPDRSAPLVSSASDDRLLDEFLSGDGHEAEDAFRTLVARHGAMVMGVCRHVLHHDQDAEDAFQATFLTLARKADSIRDGCLLAGWLYEVAYRIAIRARASAAKRRDHERIGGSMSPTTSTALHETDVAWAELRPVLHDEVSRLPEKYRLPIILSYLEGKSNEEVAGLLDWPVGTVKGRLSRARDLLRSRLLRRGLVLSAAFLCTTLTQGAVFAEVVPESLVDRTMLLVLRRRGGVASLAAQRSSGGYRSAEASRVEELARDVARRTRRRRTPMPSPVVLITVVSIGFVIVSLMLGDPRISFRLKSGLQSLAYWHRSWWVSERTGLIH